MSKRSPKAPDSIELLRADHKHMSELFAAYEGTRSLPKKRALVEQICTQLSVHAQVEEVILYPAAKAALKDEELVPEATVERATLTAFISQIEGVEPGDEMFEARVTVLAEYVKHHVKEEQNEMFPKAKASGLDMAKLGSQLAARKQQFLAAAG